MSRSEQVAAAEAGGYSFAVRHQPAAELEQPDWAVVVTTPQGRVVFPAAVDDEEHLAWERALRWVAQDRMAHGQPRG